MKKNGPLRYIIDGGRDIGPLKTNMPIQRTTVKGKPAYKYGERGHAYTYTAGSEASREAAKKKSYCTGLGNCA